jgi:hypothetical protein
MTTPKITYNDATGQPQTLQFLYPPTSKPLFNKQAKRSDTFSTAGIRQTVLQRVNDSLPIQMVTILNDGQDNVQWQSFLDWAVTGGPFEYFPDSQNLEDHYTCFLLESDAQLSFSVSGIFSFSGTFQREIT